MDCEHFDKVNLELLYGELDDLTAAAARRHESHCARCRSIYAGLRATRDVAAVPFVTPPEGLRARILEAERTASKQLSFRERVGRTVSMLAGYAMRPQLAMAALLLLMVGSSLVFLRARPGDHDQVSVLERGAPEVESEPIVRAKPSSAIEEELALGAQEERRAESSRAEAKPEHVIAGKDDAEAAPPPAQFATALAAYEAGRYAEAESAFAAIAARGGEDAGRAALHQAHAARNGSGCERAAALYDSVGARFAGTSTADAASWQAAACYLALGQPARARAHYVALLDRPAYAARARVALSELSPPGTGTGVSTSSESEAKAGSAAAVAAPAGKADAAPAPASAPAAASKRSAPARSAPAPASAAEQPTDSE